MVAAVLMATSFVTANLRYASQAQATSPGFAKKICNENAKKKTPAKKPAAKKKSS
jgi:hypothetical protein